ncbi:MAG TPA: hypothetical protein VHR17_16130, partial [Thermoanaerobaculia bacterium]|nr:hypothetical protein [Thermoanaerobaculia bacterium]
MAAPIAALTSLVVAALVATSCGGGSGAGAVSFAGPTAGWPSYGGDPGGMRYSPLTQIDRGNVDALEVAWTFHTGETLGDRPF